MRSVWYSSKKRISAPKIMSNSCCFSYGYLCVSFANLEPHEYEHPEIRTGSFSEKFEAIFDMRKGTFSSFPSEITVYTQYPSSLPSLPPECPSYSLPNL
jgi:hypothetical protein